MNLIGTNLSATNKKELIWGFFGSDIFREKS